MFKRYGMFPSLSAIAKSLPTMLNVFTTRADLVRAGAGATPERFAPSVAGQAAIFDGLDTVFGTPSVVTVRQTQRLGPVDSSGYNATLSAGAGLNFNVDASPTAVVLDFAAGSVDYTATITADASDQGSLAASNTNFIHATYVSPTSVTWSNCLVPPQYGYAFDRSCNLLCRWPGADAATSTTEDFGHSITLVGNAQVDTGITIRGSNVLLLDGTGDYATIPSTLTRVGQDGSSWEIEFDFRSASLPGGGASQQILHLYNGSGYGVYLDLYNNGAGSTYLRFSASANGSAWDIASASAGAKTTGWATGTNYTGRLAFDALAGTYKLYLSIAGAAESADISVSSSSRVCAITGGRIGADSSGSFFWNGSIGTFAIRPCVSRTSTGTPSASAPTITDYPVHFFSIPKMTMYEVTAPSASAGTDPAMTARVRQFRGEQDTNGSAVTATRNYALMGKYESLADTTVATSSAYSKSHNLGVRPGKMRAIAVCVTADNGYVPGDEFDINTPDNNGVSTNGATLSSDRNIMRLATGNSNPFVACPRAGGNMFVPTLTSWKVKFIAERGW